MQFTFSDEQDQFRAMVRRFLDSHSSTTDVRRLMDTAHGYDPEVWRQLSVELGLPAIHIPEAYGGAGFGLVELAIVMEESGRALFCAPYLSTCVMAAVAVMEGGSEAQKQALLPTLASGERLATLAVAESTGSWRADDVTLSASPAGDDYVLNGHKSFVVDGEIADLLIVAGRIDGQTGQDGVALFHLTGDAEGLSRRALSSIDPTRKLARLDFDNTPATLLEGAPGAVALNATLDTAAIALANEMVGGAEQLLTTAIDYAKLRVQFGRAISSFQAIKHRCADLLLEVESAKSAAYCAAEAAAAADPETGAYASLAKASAAEAFRQAAAGCIQIHGGIGFTWENDTHLWFKRAKCSEVLLGDPSYHREKMLMAWGY